MRSAPLGPILLLLVGSGLIAVGCSEELGPEHFATTTVRGTVLVGGRPVGAGFIEFHPAPGTQGNLRVGPLATDGTFQLDRVAVGKVFVSLTQLPAGSIPSPRGPVDPRVFSINQANAADRILLERTIPADDPFSLPPIDLIKEAARHQQKRVGRRRKRSGRGPRLLDRPSRSSGMQRHLSPDPADTGSRRASGTLTIQVIYRDGQGVIHLDYPVAQIRTAIADLAGTVWIDVEDLDSAHNAEVEVMFRDTFQFHPLAIEDALKDTNVPRIDDWNNYLYLIVNTLDFHPETDDLQLHELDLFVGANYILTYHHEAIPVLDRHRHLIQHEPEDRLKQGASHLLHRLLDDVVDEFLPAIEHLDDAIDEAQDEVFSHATPNTLRRIFHIKSCALRLHRVAIPMREVLNRLARDPYPQVRAEHRVYFRDVYDHLVRVHDIVEILRDLIGGALDTYLSIVSNRTNEIMKVLTILNVMFLPMSFLASFFGMNFFGETLMFTSPDLPKTALFGLTVTIMILTPVVMYLSARLRGWF